MNIENALNGFCEKHFNETNDWYSWRKINATLIPNRVKAEGINQYFQNINLKGALHKEWLLAIDDKRKEELVKYYIKDWGGIKSNGENKLKEYTHAREDNLIQKGKSGIASWSKALVVRNPSQYAIFDARVSASLNCLQIIHNIENKVLYPLLSSRNNKIKIGNKMLDTLSKKGSWTKANDIDFYNDYLVLLNGVANKRNEHISTVEMLLFAKAEDLVDEAQEFIK